MIGLRLSSHYEQRLTQLAEQAGTNPTAYARQVIIASIEGKEDAPARLEHRLARIEQLLLRLLDSQAEHSAQLGAFLENAEVIEPM
jgi:predicted DNA-binding protein